MNIGFTGTRKGMTDKQHYEVAYVLRAYGSDDFHHGDCLGSDEQAATIAKLEGYRIIGHPPLNNKFYAYFDNDITLEPKDYLLRNADIVDASELIIATPDSRKERVQGSGTWATIRYAKQLNKSLIIIYPDGRFSP